METLVNIIGALSVLAAGAMLGKMFFTETRNAHRKNAPWYAPFMSLPGILVLIALAVPIIIWLVRA